MSTETISLDASAHPVKAVTIFQSSLAQLTRTFTIDLKSGSNLLEISGISSNIKPDSPRIHGLGADTRVVDISCNVKSFKLTTPSQHRSKNAAAIKTLEEERELLDAERNVREAEWNELSLKVISRNLKWDSIDELMTTFITRKRNAMQAAVQMRMRIKEVDEEITLLRDSRKGETSGVISVTLLVKSDCKLEFHLTYLVTGVTWTPYYDLHGTMADGKPSLDVILHYRANITQITGEDWTNAVLTLRIDNSHSLHTLAAVPEADSLRLFPLGRRQNSLRGLSTPINNTRIRSVAEQMTLVPATVDLFNPPPSRRSDPVHRQAPSSPPSTPIMRDFNDKDSVVKNGLAAGVVVNKNPLLLAYRVEGHVSLPSDGAAHNVSIAVLGFSAALKYVCVPRKTSAVFMEGQIQNTSEYELPAGLVNVFMDNNFVTKTSLRFVGVNESFTCVLGLDNSLKVSYQKNSRTEREPERSFAEPFKTTTRTATTTITNGHSFDVTGLVVRDAIPLGNDDAKFKVTICRPARLAQAKNGEEVPVALSPSGAGHSGGQELEARVRWAVRTENGDGGEKEGLYEWVCDIKAGKKIKLETEWKIKTPSDAQWEEKLNIRDERDRKE